MNEGCSDRVLTAHCRISLLKAITLIKVKVKGVSFLRKQLFANFARRRSFCSVGHVEYVTKAQERLLKRLNICLLTGLLCLFPFIVISRAVRVGLAMGSRQTLFTIPTIFIRTFKLGLKG